jgi:NAD(P)H dehydrogenase (quinone)
MKVAIVFHSVCGNSYLVAKAFRDGLASVGHQVGLFRVADPDWAEKPDVPDAAKAVLSAMRRVPEAKPEDLLDADLVIMGSPTYFGNVTAEMKTFMDATGGLWFQGKLVGKKLFPYASAGNTEGGGDLCLQAIHTYGKYMGMLGVPLPVGTLPGDNICALGVIQYSNGKYAEVLDEKTARVVKNCCTFLSGLA